MNKRSRYNIPVIRLTVLLVFAVLALMPACGGEKAPTGTTKLIILHVNDVHAKIGKFAKIAGYAAKIKKENPDADVLLLNGGDNFSGNPAVDLYEPKAEPMYRLMGMMGFDAMAIGNHDFDYGQEPLKRFMDNVGCACLLANIQSNSPLLPQPQAFTVIKTKNHLKIAILGLLQVSKSTGFPSSHPKNLTGLTFMDPIETALKYRHLRNENHVFLALSHMGFRNDVILADKMSELDLIVGGHSHTRITEPEETSGVLITQAGGNGYYVGHIELTLENGKVIEKKGRLIDTRDIAEEDLKIKELADKYNDNPALNKVVTELPFSPKGKMELGNLITDGLCRLHNLDIAFHNNGGIRARFLPQAVKVKDIYALHPFSNLVVMIKMTPAEIRSLIINDYNRGKRADLQVSGLTVTITAGEDLLVKELKLSDTKGNPLDENKSYTVAMNSFMASSYKFDHQDPGTSLGITNAQSLKKFLEEQQVTEQEIKKTRIFVSKPGNNENKDNNKDKEYNP